VRQQFAQRRVEGDPSQGSGVNRSKTSYHGCGPHFQLVVSGVFDVGDQQKAADSFYIITQRLVRFLPYGL